MSEAISAQITDATSVPPSHGRDRLSATRRRICLALMVAAMVAYFAPFLILGNRSYVTIHDNLDGEFVVYYLLAKTGTAFVFDGAATIPNIMNGLPRAAVPSGLNVLVLLFYVFPPAWAYIVNFILVHCIALGGMFLLLRRHFLPEDDDYLIAGAISICFFLVPYYTIYGLTVAGQPLLAYAFLNIRSGKHSWVDYLIICFFPFWSDIALAGVFVIVATIVLLAIDWIRWRELNKRFLGGIAILGAVYMALQYQLVHSILAGTGSWISQRTTWNRWTDFQVSSNLGKTLELLRTTQYHTGSYSTLPVIVAFAATLVLLIARKRRAGLVDLLAIMIAGICLEFGFYDWLVRWFGRFIPGLQTFNGSRFYFLLPVLWLLLFALTLKQLTHVKWGRPAAWCLIALQMCAILKFNTEYENNIRFLLRRQIYEPSFNGFFAPDLLADVDKFIGRPKDSYRVVSVGMHPTIAQFNGFYTLDGYLTNYPLEYKEQFRNVIAKELAKSPYLRDYFDGWGNRCYAFSSELGMNELCSAAGRNVVHDLELNTGQLRSMGCEYVISAARIENSIEHGLRLEHEFYRPDSYWHIYLYYVLPENPGQVAMANGNDAQGVGLLSGSVPVARTAR